VLISCSKFEQVKNEIHTGYRRFRISEFQGSWHVKYCKSKKLSHYRPEEAQRAPGPLDF